MQRNYTQPIKKNGKNLYKLLKSLFFRDRLERLGKKRLGSRRRSVLASDKEDSASSAASSRVQSPVRDKPVESPTPQKARLSTPNLKPGYFLENFVNK